MIWTVSCVDSNCSSLDYAVDGNVHAAVSAHVDVIVRVVVIAPVDENVGAGVFGHFDMMVHFVYAHAAVFVFAVVTFHDAAYCGSQ